MNRKDIIIGFLALITIGEIISVVASMIASGLYGQEVYQIWTTITNLFILFFFVAMTFYLIDERKREQATSETDTESLM